MRERSVMIAAGAALVLFEVAVGAGLHFGLAPLALVAAALPLIVIVGDRMPEGVFAAFLFAGSTTIGSVVPVDVGMLLGGVVVLLIMMRIGRDGMPSVPLGVWLFLAAVVLVGVSFAYSDFSAYGWAKVTRFVPLGTIAAVAPLVLLRTEESFQRFTYWLIGVGTTLALTASARQFIFGISGRYEALGAGTIALARATGLAIGACLVVLLWRKRAWWWTFPIIGVSLWALVNTASRGPLIALVGGLAALALLGVALGRIKPGPLLVGGVGLAGLVPFATRLIPQYVMERYLLLLTNEPGSSTFVRLVAGQDAIRTAVEVPFTGIGTGSFAAMQPQLLYPHNIVLELAAENGVLTAILGLLFLALAVLAAMRAARNRPGAGTSFLFFALVFYVLNSMVSGDINANYMLYAFSSVALAWGFGALETVHPRTAVRWGHSLRELRIPARLQRSTPAWLDRW